MCPHMGQLKSQGFLRDEFGVLLCLSLIITMIKTLFCSVLLRSGSLAGVESRAHPASHLGPMALANGWLA